MSGRDRTHSTECWKWHPSCAEPTMTVGPDQHATDQLPDHPPAVPKVLSLWQPWASLVALRAKMIETRSWSTRHRGPLYIHAAKSLRAVPPGAQIPIGEYTTERDRAGLLLRGPLRWPYRLPLGVIVARVNLADVIPTEQLVFYGNTEQMTGQRWVQVPQRDPELEPAYVEADAAEKPYGDYSPGRFAWLFNDVEPLNPPVPSRGRQGLFDPPAGMAS